MLLAWVHVSSYLLGNVSGETCPGDHADAHRPYLHVGSEHLSALTADFQLSECRFAMFCEISDDLSSCGKP